MTKTWSDEDLDSALEALRRKEMSANKASKQFGVPSSVSDECLLVVFMAIFLSLCRPYTKWQGERKLNLPHRSMQFKRRGVQND